jgi:hypothetical protein
MGYADAEVLEVPGAVHVDFRKRVGLVYMGEDAIAIVRDGAFHGCGWDVRSVPGALADCLSDRLKDVGGKGIAAIAQVALHAAEDGHGATVLIDASGDARRRLSGHLVRNPLDLRIADGANLELTANLGHVDGAVVVSLDGHMHGFGYLLDGDSMKTEDPARGARFNTALRYSNAHREDVLLVVSSDGPIKIFARGEVVFPPREDAQVIEGADPTLKDWLRQNSAAPKPESRRGRPRAPRRSGRDS